MSGITHSFLTVFSTPAKIDDWKGVTPTAPYDTGSTGIPITVILPVSLGGQGLGAVKVCGTTTVRITEVVCGQVDHIDLDPI